MNLEFVAGAIKGTPTWVFVIFFYLLFVGINAMSKHSISIYKMAILPTVMTLWLLRKAMLGGSIAQVFSSFIGPLALGALAGFSLLYQKPITINRRNLTMTFAGTKLTLVVLMSIFVIKYFFGYMHATNQTFIASYGWVESALFASISGLFLGRFFKNCFRFWTKVS